MNHADGEKAEIKWSNSEDQRSLAMTTWQTHANLCHNNPLHYFRNLQLETSGHKKFASKSDLDPEFAWADGESGKPFPRLARHQGKLKKKGVVKPQSWQPWVQFKLTDTVFVVELVRSLSSVRSALCAFIPEGPGARIFFFSFFFHTFLTSKSDWQCGLSIVNPHAAILVDRAARACKFNK